MFRTLTLALALALGACDTGEAPAPEAAEPTPDAPATAAPANAKDGDAKDAVAKDAGDGASVSVKNPLGMELKGTKHVDPAANTVERTLVDAIQHQAKNGSFQGFLEFIHPTKKDTPEQKANLEAYIWKSSKGKKAEQCLHDGGIITVSRKPVKTTIQGGGNEGLKVMVWCGEGRMPVPFTLYPDGEAQKITVFGLN